MPFDSNPFDDRFGNHPWAPPERRPLTAGRGPRRRIEPFAIVALAAVAAFAADHLRAAPARTPEPLAAVRRGNLRLDADGSRILVLRPVTSDAPLLRTDPAAPVTGDAGDPPSVRVSDRALVREAGAEPHLWTRAQDGAYASRIVRVVSEAGPDGTVTVAGNVRPGDPVVTHGALFLDRAARGG